MRVPSLLAATGLVAAGLITISPPAAHAEGSCSLYVVSKFYVSQPYRSIPVTQGPNCASAGVVDAAWTAFHPSTPTSVVTFPNAARSDTVDLYDSVPLGRWTWRPGYAYDANNNPVFQYSPVTEVRLGSYGRVTATRAGARVTLKTTAMRYWSSGNKFIGFSAAVGQIQYRTPGTTTWRGLKDVYSTSTGTYSYTYTFAAARDYRLALNGTSQIWNSISPTVRR